MIMNDQDLQDQLKILLEFFDKRTQTKFFMKLVREMVKKEQVCSHFLPNQLTFQPELMTNAEKKRILEIDLIGPVTEIGN